MAAKKKSIPLIKALACCFICDRPLGATYMTASKYVPATCLRCGGRVHGLVLAAMEPLVALLREVELGGGVGWVGANSDECLVCGMEVSMGSAHASDCVLALAIGGRV